MRREAGFHPLRSAGWGFLPLPGERARLAAAQEELDALVAEIAQHHQALADLLEPLDDLGDDLVVDDRPDTDTDTSDAPQEPNGGLVVLVVDAEDQPADAVSAMLADDDRVSVVLRARDSVEALRAVSSRPVDLVLTTISLPGLDGLEMTRLLGAMVEPPAVVVVAGSDDQVAEAFDVGAVDCLVTPVREERLRQTIERLTGRSSPATAAEQGVVTVVGEGVRVEASGRTTRIPRSAVRFVEAQGDYARLHTADDSYLARIPLSVLEERWARGGFVRVHRTYLVALSAITSVRRTETGWVVRLGRENDDDLELPVSRGYVYALREALRRRLERSQADR